ncbi:MAG: hypothetical protein AAF202_13040 [Pseudomonadota bacterium]
MRFVRVLITLTLVSSLLGCYGQGFGGTDTGPARSPDQGNSTPAEKLDLFSEQGVKDPNWIDTDQNSLNIANFTSYTQLNNETVFATDPLDKNLEHYENVHSHYFADQSEFWSNYTFRGKIKIEEDDASAGVTFLSQYPYERSYYRIRQFVATNAEKQRFRKEYHLTFPEAGGWDSKHVCKRADGVEEGDYTSNVIPVAGVWYYFEIKVIIHDDSTEIQAKIWPELLPQPRELQIHCFDFRPERLTNGTVGIWHGVWDKQYQSNYDGGRKFYDDFSVEFDD